MKQVKSKRCKVVMLATEESIIRKNKYRDLLAKSPEPMKEDSLGIPQHLYIIDPKAEIKEGDWCLHKTGKNRSGFDMKDVVRQAFGKDIEKWCSVSAGNEFHEKIIASTDESLGLPSPSPQFIDKYIEEYNKGKPIGWVDVEMEKHVDQHPDWKPTHNNPDDPPVVSFWLPKTDKNNYITIRKVKDSWARDEVEELIDRLNDDFSLNIYPENIKKWLEENL
jgi:hypothetical protein